MPIEAPKLGNTVAEWAGHGGWKTARSGIVHIMDGKSASWTNR
jgi:hypothetical protein